MKFIKLFLIITPLLVSAQPNNLDFHLNAKLNRTTEIKFIYNDAEIDASEDDQYSKILSNKLFNSLNKEKISVIFPQDLKDSCSSKNCSNINEIDMDENFIYIFISTQSAGGRTTINGTIYQSNKVIGGFTSYRSYWTNKRFENLSSSITENLLE
jgi:hypothetical protein